MSCPEGRWVFPLGSVAATPEKSLWLVFSCGSVGLFLGVDVFSYGSMSFPAGQYLFLGVGVRVCACVRGFKESLGTLRGKDK